MPNYCENEITVKGQKKDVVKFFGKCKGECFSFNDFIPIPKTFLDYDTTNKIRPRDAVTRTTDGKCVPLFNSDEEYDKYVNGYNEAKEYQKKTYGVVGWYDWNIQNWGTKWDACDSPDVKDIMRMIPKSAKDDEVVSVSFFFDTAWDECDRFLFGVARMFPELEFNLNYMETGNYFCGHLHLYHSDGELIEDNETGEPSVVEIETNTEIDTAEMRRLEAENGIDENDGWGIIYDTANLLAIEI